MNLTERESLACYISDAHKDAYGFRPRGTYDIDSMSIEELRALADRLSDAVGETIEREAREAAERATEFEAFISGLMADHGIDRVTAIRWDIEAEGDALSIGQYGWSHYEWSKGLPFGYFEGSIPAFCKEAMDAWQAELEEAA